jgi:hypothetical protein
MVSLPILLSRRHFFFFRFPSFFLGPSLYIYIYISTGMSAVVSVSRMFTNTTNARRIGRVNQGPSRGSSRLRRLRRQRGTQLNEQRWRACRFSSMNSTLSRRGVQSEVADEQARYSSHRFFFFFFPTVLYIYTTACPSFNLSSYATGQGNYG